MPMRHVIGLSTLRPGELAHLWQSERQSWQERLLWNISDPLHRLRRMVERGTISGKALLDGTEAAAYACYNRAGSLAVVSRLVISPRCDADGAAMLIRETVRAIRRTGASRIEAPFLSIDDRKLPELFEQQGFRIYWREFLRRQLNTRANLEPNSNENPLALRRAHVTPFVACGSSGHALTSLELLRGSNLRAAASVMHAAYEGGVDAEINGQYRTDNGCEQVLDDIVNQSGCGNLVGEASVVAHHRGRAIGFIVVTEIGHQQAHLAQIAVIPEYQKQGVGRLLLRHGLSRLAEQAFETMSLIVSRQNHRALNWYKLMGFELILSFPVFTWQA